MLVPVLEVLLFGYNVIFFDIDIGLVVDPVPYLVRGNADLVFAQEVRHCPETYSVPDRTHTSSLPSRSNSSHAKGSRQQQHQRTEPNTGVSLYLSMYPIKLHNWNDFICDHLSSRPCW